MKETVQQKTRSKPPLQVADFICLRCRVQATCDEDHICGICKAFGKSVEPPTRNTSRRKGNLAALAMPIMIWLEGHHWIELNTAAAIIQKED